jgi:GntR family transcriptional regulator/MocR family aminotransferase
VPWKAVAGNDQLRRFRYNHYNWVVKRTAGAFSPVIAVDRGASTPLHKQIYDGYRSVILARKLRAGQQVPSSRALADELNISRIPVLNAYGQLLAEGYFESRAGSGTFVSSSLPEQMTSVQVRQKADGTTGSSARPVSERSLTVPVRDQTRPYGPGAFSVGQLAFDHFPFGVWSNLIGRYTRRLTSAALNYSDAMGHLEFRRAISTYLRTARGVECDASQIMVVGGSQQALEISARVLLDPGCPVWIEEPGYFLLRHALVLAGCRLVPVPVDGEGLDVAAGIRLCRRARAAFVIPSHQFPLGVTMSASRRLQLLNWAETSGAWVIEDDYDSEYRYESMPIASLQGLDRHSRVIYIGTFSKTLFPALRLGYLVIPPDLVDRFRTVRTIMDICPPHLYQAVLADFIEEGHFARHIRKTRLLYSERRSALVEAIRSEFGDALEIVGADAGMHLTILLPDGTCDVQIAARAAEEKLWLWPLSAAYAGQARRQGFILGFGNTEAKDALPAVKKMKRLIEFQGVSSNGK